VQRVCIPDLYARVQVVEDVILLKCAMAVVIEIHPNLHSVYR